MATAAKMSNSWSFAHWGKGFVDTMILHEAGDVSFNAGPRHGRWYQNPRHADIFIEWDSRGDQENVQMHVYRHLPADVNSWQLILRSDEEIPNRNHPFRCVLIMTNTQQNDRAVCPSGRGLQNPLAEMDMPTDHAAQMHGPWARWPRPAPPTPGPYSRPTIPTPGP